MLQPSHGDRSAKIQHVFDCLSNPEGNQNISQEPTQKEADGVQLLQ